MTDESSVATVTEMKVLLGILALLAADRDERIDEAAPRRTELILDDAGFSPREIAQVTGKQYEAVRSALRRAKSDAGKKRTKGA